MSDKFTYKIEFRIDGLPRHTPSITFLPDEDESEIERLTTTNAQLKARNEELERNVELWKSVADGRAIDVDTLLEIAGVDYNFVEDYQVSKQECDK